MRQEIQNWWLQAKKDLETKQKVQGHSLVYLG